MVYRDPKCVYVTDSPGVADVLVNFLEHEGIPAKVMDRTTLGGLLGLTVWSNSAVSSLGLEIWVHDEKDGVRARNLLAEFEAAEAHRSANRDAGGPVDAQCEECDRFSTFDGKYRGTVQDCPHCGAFMDVPGDEDEFDWNVAESGDD